MKIKISDVHKLLVAILTELKLTKGEAVIVANEYLEGELQGKSSHGLMAFFSLVKKLPIKNKKIIIKKNNASTIFVDARQSLGLIVGRQFADLAIQKARKQGTVAVFLKNMITWLRPGAIAAHIAQRNMIGLVMNSGGSPMVAPPGGFEPMVGTNPIGIGIPANGGDIIVDMATSKRAWGAVREAVAHKANLPRNTFFDNQGNFTLDPIKAVSIIGAEDYKGFSLALFIEILTGSLIDMPMSLNKTKSADYRNRPRGAVIFVINPAFFTSLESFKRQNKGLAEKIRRSKKRKGFKKINLPGDKAAEVRADSIRNGFINISSDLWNRLSSLK